MPREKSRLAFDRAKKLIPGGVNSPARAFGGVGGEPIFIDRAEGAYLFDLDGNRYVDYLLMRRLVVSQPACPGRSGQGNNLAAGLKPDYSDHWLNREGLSKVAERRHTELYRAERVYNYIVGVIMGIVRVHQRYSFI